MDAVHLAGALTGRDLIIKVEGSITATMTRCRCPCSPRPTRSDRANRPTQVPGTPASRRDTRSRVVVPFNDTGAVARALAEHRGKSRR